MNIKTTIKSLLPKMALERLREKVRSIKYFGLRYRCPCCRSRLRRLLPTGVASSVLEEVSVVGGGKREQAICPICFSSERERLIYLYLEKVIGIREVRIRLLHVAPEHSIFRFLSKLKNINYLTADILRKDVDVQMDITSIDYPDGVFNSIICSHVLEHIVDDKRAMRELYRVLAPGGWAILQVPISRGLSQTYEDTSVKNEAECERVFGQRDHVRIYATDYTDRLLSVGFNVTLFKWWEQNKILLNHNNQFGLLANEILYVANKPYK